MLTLKDVGPPGAATLPAFSPTTGAWHTPVRRPWPLPHNGLHPERSGLHFAPSPTMSASPSTTPDGARRFEALRIRGHQGGVIQPHRSMGGLPWGTGRLAGVGGLAALAVAGYVAALPALLAAWRWAFDWARGWLGLRLMLGDQFVIVPGGFALRFPELSTITPQPGAAALLIAAVVSIAAFGATFLMPPRLTPLRFFIRLLTVVQASAILFFAASPEPFPFRVSDYLFGLMSTGMLAMGLTPVLLAATLYPMDLGWLRKVTATVLMLLHFAVLTPLLVLVHAGLLLRGTAVVMPTLFLGFGIFPFVLVFLALYGWAMSGSSEMERREVPAPVHSAR